MIAPLIAALNRCDLGWKWGLVFLVHIGKLEQLLVNVPWGGNVGVSSNPYMENWSTSVYVCSGREIV